MSRQQFRSAFQQHYVSNASTPPKVAAHRGPHHLVFASALLLLLLAQLLNGWAFGTPAVALAARKPPVASAHLTFQQFLKETAHVKRATMPVPAKLPVTPVHLMHSTAPSQLPPSAEPPTMQPLQATLTPAFLNNSPGAQPLDLVSSDHRLEVHLVPGSLDFSQAHVSGSGSSPRRHTMPNQDYLDLLMQGVEVWNTWRENHEDMIPDLRGVDLQARDLHGIALFEADLRGANLAKANLRGANLHSADLRGVTLVGVDLCGADLSDAVLDGASLEFADLREANFLGTYLYGAKLSGANISQVDLLYAHLLGTQLQGANLNGTRLSQKRLKYILVQENILKHAQIVDK